MGDPVLFRALVVDDEQLFAQRLADVLSQRGTAADWVLNAEDALSKYHDYDVLLVDLSLPEMSGIELARRINEVAPDKSLLLLTGHQVLKREAEAVGARFLELYDKPIVGESFEDLMDVMEILATQKRRKERIKRLTSAPSVAAIANSRGNAAMSAKYSARVAKVRTDFDVFMAHNSHDRRRVQELADKLRERGLNPWIDAEQVPPGRWFQDVIQRAMPEVGAAAIFIGSQGLGRWEALELRTFISRCLDSEIPVIPVLLPGVDELPGELLFLRELSWVRFIDRIDDIEGLDNLEWGITGIHPRRNA